MAELALLDVYKRQNEIPACTEGYEGFYHLTEMSGTVEEATLSYIIRDHSREKFEQRKQAVAAAAAEIEMCIRDRRGAVLGCI